MAEPLYAKSNLPSSWKPRISFEDVPFFHCSVCNKTLMGVDSGVPTHYTGEDRDPMITHPYMNWGSVPNCCGQEMERIIPKALSELPNDFSIDYEITGGFGTNLIRLIWDSNDEETTPDWVALKTFTGMQIKYRLPQQSPSFVFALTETDSYAYCSEDPCLKCIFHCKRGNSLYVHTSRYGLVEVPIHENSPR